MGLGRQKFTVLKVGEFAQETGAVYYGGSPMAITQTGTLRNAKYAQLASAKSDATATTYVGIAYNTSTVDADTYGGKSTFLAGACVVTMSKMLANTNNSVLNVQGTAGQSGDDYPYDTTLTWNEADLLFVGHTGKWVNVNPASGKPAFGTVLEVGTDSITVLLYGGTNAVY